MPDIDSNAAPTLRQDMMEARERVDVSRHHLDGLFAGGHKWSDDDKKMAIDGLDSLITCIDSCLPFIPVSVIREVQPVQHRYHATDTMAELREAFAAADADADKDNGDEVDI